MAKKTSLWCCSECGNESPKLLGKCPSCGHWNTYKEVTLTSRGGSAKSSSVFTSDTRPEKIGTISTTTLDRINTGIQEWDRVLGGMVAGQAVLLSGEPGIGKSTLLLQAAQRLSQKGAVLYINGEESSSQVKLRAERLGIQSEDLFLYPETDLDAILHILSVETPAFLIADSLQTLSDPSLDSAPGSLPQMRSCTQALVRACKTKGIPAVLVSHVTKDGAIAGPKAVEHLVDTVLFLESDTRGIYRVLRALKNRFCATDEAGFFEMGTQGLIAADDLSGAFVSIHDEEVFGSAIFAHSEGQRVFPIEIQALCHMSGQNYPRRTAEGLDYNRLALLSAVVEKQLRIPLFKNDVYANITGGLSVSDPSSDLPLIAALCSSFKEKPIPQNSVFFGEVGLSGELRPVRGMEKRIKECARLGFKSIYLPYAKNSKELFANYPVRPLRHVTELISVLF
ncbi:MAG: DNA repair protein RadA [Brevinema sp.]